MSEGSDALKDNIVIDDAMDTVTVFGIKYSGALFRSFGFGFNTEDYFRIAKREDGVITLEKVDPSVLSTKKEAS